MQTMPFAELASSVSCPSELNPFDTRAVNSTLGAESQALATASGSVEWLLLLLAEALDGSFDLHKSEKFWVAGSRCW